jgi:hypothetical protein
MYELDTNQARRADNVISMISEIGQFSGTIEVAYAVKAKTGAKGVGIVFKTASGEKANFTLYTHNKDGEKIMGFDQLMALMTVVKVRDIKPVKAVIKQWDSELRKEVDVQADVFPELQAKPLQILFQTEEYEANDKSIKTKVTPRYFLSADGFSASEILDKKTEQKHGEQMRKSLRHRPLKTSIRDTVATKLSAGGETGFDDMNDDDIPWN